MLIREKIDRIRALKVDELKYTTELQRVNEIESRYCYTDTFFTVDPSVSEELDDIFATMSNELKAHQDNDYVAIRISKNILKTSFMDTLRYVIGLQNVVDHLELVDIDTYMDFVVRDSKALLYEVNNTTDIYDCCCKLKKTIDMAIINCYKKPHNTVLAGVLQDIYTLYKQGICEDHVMILHGLENSIKTFAISSEDALKVIEHIKNALQVKNTTTKDASSDISLSPIQVKTLLCALKYTPPQPFTSQSTHTDTETTLSNREFFNAIGTAYGLTKEELDYLWYKMHIYLKKQVLHSKHERQIILPDEFKEVLQ